MVFTCLLRSRLDMQQKGFETFGNARRLDADLTQTAVPSESVIPAGAKCAAGSKLADRMAYIVHTCSSLKKCFSIDAFALYSL